MVQVSKSCHKLATAMEKSDHFGLLACALCISIKLLEALVLASVEHASHSYVECRFVEYLPSNSLEPPLNEWIYRDHLHSWFGLLPS